MNNEERILEMLAQLQTDMAGMKTDMAGMKTDMDGMKTDMAGMKTDMAGMKETMNRLDERTVKLEMTQENTILPQLKLLAEGQRTILETLAPKNRVEELEEEVAFLKTVIRIHSEEIATLKKA